MSWRATGLVIEREVREAARRRGIWALLALTFLGSAALVAAPSVLPDLDDNTRVIIIYEDRIGLTEALEAVTERDLELLTGDDLDDGTTAIAERRADVAVILIGTRRPLMIVEDEDSGLVPLVRGVVAERIIAARFAEAGVTDDLVAGAFADADPKIEAADPDREGQESAALGVTLVLYLLTVVLTSQVANAIAIEKSNRVSEVLLAMVPPRALLFGKVIGVSCIGLATLIAGATPVVLQMLGGGELPAGMGRTLAGSALWFVAGLALYLLLGATLGALVGRQEEAGAVVLPLTIFLVGGYIVALIAADTAFGAVLSFVPFVAPMIVPYRIAIEVGTIGEYVGSALVLVLSVAVAARVGAAVFRRAIVRTGRRLTLREMLTTAD